MTLLMHYQEHEEIGKEQERRKIIVKMIDQGFSTEQIMVVCDTSKEEIERCKKNM